MWSLIRRITLFTAICAASLRPASAQPSHADMLSEMAERCLGPVVDPTDSVRVDFDGTPAFMETHLLRTWIDEGRTVLTGDGSATATRLNVILNDAGVELVRASRGMLERTALLAITYRLTAASGAVLAADTCRSSDQDLIDADVAGSLADDSFAGTSPDIPTTSRLRRIVEPVVVIGAAAIGTYLFFNLRSRRSDN